MKRWSLFIFLKSRKKIISFWLIISCPHLPAIGSPKMRESGTSVKMRISRKKKNRDHEIKEKGLKNPIGPSVKRHIIRHHSTSSMSLSAWRFINVANCLADRNWTLGHHQIFAGNFEAWDTNKDGYVDTDEVQYVLFKDKGVFTPPFSMFDTHIGPKAQSKHPIEGSFCVTVI